MRSLRWQKYDSKKKFKKIIVEIFFKKSADNRLISADKIGILDGTQSYSSPSWHRFKAAFMEIFRKFFQIFK